MRTITLRLWLLILSVLFWRTEPSAIAADAQGTTRVELMIDEGGTPRTVAWPVTTGVPFPRGALTRETSCRLVDDRGDEQPLQSRAAATWDAERSSIRWLTIDFIAHPGRTYALEFGADVVCREFPAALTVRDAQSVLVETGALRVEFARGGPAALHAVCVDLNADGRIEESERVASGPAEGDHVLAGQSRAMPTGETSPNPQDGDEREIAIESLGPVRACVRVDGWYAGPGGRRIVRYRTRYHMFAGLPLLKLVDEFRVVRSTRDVHFSDIALPLAIDLDPKSRRVAAAWHDAPDGCLPLSWDAATRSLSLVQETYRHYGNPECRAAMIERTDQEERRLQEAEQCGAWLQAADGRAAITGSLRWFWQQFPKEWELTGDRLILHLWSPRSEPLDFGEAGLRAFFGPAGHKYLLDWEGVAKPQSPIENFFYFAGRHALQRDGADGLGTNKHHEAWFHFGPAAAAAAGREYGALADRQPLCLASGAWNCSTGVFGPLAARPIDSPYEAIVDRIFELERYVQDAFGDYGWRLFGAGPHYSYQWDPAAQRHYADPRRFEFHTYQRETQLWWCYLRSGERKFYDWAFPSEDHWVDIAVAHTPTTFSTEWRGGERGEARLHFPAGDWSIDSPLHYVRHHDTGEAWLRSASQFWATYHRTLETTTLAYFLTGDERYADVIELWRTYWAPLAGVRSDSPVQQSDMSGVKPWHREQLWFQPTAPGRPAKSWAEMMRDYAPFQSGSRHQMTLFFNLATLYEQTWDPTIGQVLREFAAAYLAPDAPNGVWQCQDHRQPANADSPLLAHYWAPALWKYARATNDPRMPDVLRKYFTACYDADPYRGDVGVYSNVQIAWAWHFTRDPRHLVAARRQLEDLLSAAAPLAKPEDLGLRIYNPYDPIQTLAAVPRLIAVLAEAERNGTAEPRQPPLAPQRALIALHRRPGEALRAETWGWDQRPAWLDARGNPAGTIAASLAQRSHRQPFDRTLPGHEVFREVFELNASEEGSDGRDAWCFLSPAVETGILDVQGADGIWCWAGEPLLLEPGQKFWWRRSEQVAELTVESAQAGQVQISHAARPLSGKAEANASTVSVADVPAGTWLGIDNLARGAVWFRLAGVPEADRWVCVTPPSTKAPAEMEAPPSDLVARRVRPALDVRQTFVPGKFGQALLIVPGRELHIPDEIVEADGARRLSDQRKGTIEFWVKRLTDDRLTAPPQFEVMTNGSLRAWVPWKLPLDEWAHVAIVWRPAKELAGRSLAHIYVDGRDYGNYRNLYWEGYAPPPAVETGAEWRKEFVVRAPPGTILVLDDIRISTAPRHAGLSLDFGPRQTFNPVTFAPPADPAVDDEATVVRLPLDGDTRGTTIRQRPLEATIVREP